MVSQVAFRLDSQRPVSLGIWVSMKDAACLGQHHSADTLRGGCRSRSRLSVHRRHQNGGLTATDEIQTLRLAMRREPWRPGRPTPSPCPRWPSCRLTLSCTEHTDHVPGCKMSARCVTVSPRDLPTTGPMLCWAGPPSSSRAAFRAVGSGVFGRPRTTAWGRRRPWRITASPCAASTFFTQIRPRTQHRCEVTLAFDSCDHHGVRASAAGSATTNFPTVLGDYILWAARDNMRCSQGVADWADTAAM